MKKFLQLFALVAMMAAPWATKAQWCTPNPSSKDGNGITNVTFGVGSETVNSTVTWSTSPFYNDYRSQIGAVPAGTACEMSITFATGYSYGTIIWVDWDQDSTFEGSEVVWVGVSSSTNPTTLSVNFDIAATQDTGTYMMRICAADMAFDSYTGSIADAANANPCDTYSYGVGIDYTLRVTEAPSCIRPENLVATNVTSDGLTLGWSDAMNTGATYSIDYWKNGGDTNTVTSTTTSYDFSGLDANSLYYFVVKAVCSASDESLPLSGSFATACNGSTCDMTLELSGSGYTDPFTYYGGPASVELIQNGVSLGAYSSNTTVEVCSSVPVIALYHHSGYSWGDYYDQYASIIIRDGGGVAVYDGSMGDTLCTVATPCPTCIPPTALTVVPDMTEIEFSWTPRSGASQFIVYLNDSVVNDYVTDTFYTFTDLTANTLYTVGVQSVCVAGVDTSSVASTSIRTACSAMTLPFSDNFDSYDNGYWPPCWHRLRAYGTDPSVNAQFHHSGSQSMFLLAANDTTLFCTPDAVPTAGNNIYVRYHAFLNWSSYYTETKWIKAGVMTDTSDMSTFIALDSVEYHNFNDVFEEREFYTTDLDATATYWVAWMFYSSNNGYGSYNRGAIDDVYISEAPSCARVPVATIDTTTSESVTLHWADNGSTSYTVYYWANGSEDTLNASTYDTVITINGLDAMTAYSLMVVANCSGGDAEPSPVYSFGTTCAASTCTFTATVTDSYNDSWNGCGINIVQAGVTVATIECPSGQSGSTFTYDVCSSAPVTLTFTRGSYPTELGGTIYDGGGNPVFTISGMGSYYTDDVLATIANPCPNCVIPADFYLSDTTAQGVTLHWTPQEGQTAWIVRIDSTDYNVTDTFYIVTGLAQRTAHIAMVATDCSGDTSSFLSLPFITGCSDGECEIEVATSAAYDYNYYFPTLHVFQNGAELASVKGAAQTIGVCTGMAVDIIYEEPSSTYYTPSATVLNGGEEEVFTGSTEDYSDGDTLLHMDNACPSCLKPQVQITVVDSNQLTFTWTTESGINYQVAFDDDPYTTNNSGSYTATGLDPNTVHTFAVKAICAVGDTSNPRIVNMRTACGEMAIPYVEGFEGQTVGNVPSCWIVVTDGANGTPSVGNAAHSGTNGLSLSSNYTNIAMIASSAIPLQGDSIKVSFWAMNGYSGNIEYGMMTNPYDDSTFTLMGTVNATDYTFYEFNTNTLSADSVYYLAFRYNSSYDYYYGYVDDITITLDEGCMTPTNVTATPDSVSSNIIEVTWTNSGSLNNFVVIYRVYGDSAWSTPSTTMGTSKTLTGLTAATTYEIAVGLACGLDTLWGSYAHATTLCDVINLPYEENFMSATGELPPCWDYTAASYFHWNRYTTHAETSGDGELMASSGSAGEAAILPNFYAPIIKLQISFKAKLGNVSEGDGIMMGAYDVSTGTVDWIDTLTNPGQSRENFVVFTYNYLNYTGTGTRIAIGHSHNNPSDWGFAIDSIVVLELASCNPPEEVTANNTMYPNTADDVYFTWTYSTSGTSVPSEWQVYIDTITSTVNIDSVAESELVTVDTNYYMPAINTLAEGAHYRFFVRSKCGGDHSEWVELQGGFATDEYWMNNSATFDTIVGCDFIVYDNGGPVAGYLHNSNSNLIIQAGETNRELQLQGAFFSHGDDANTFTVYDGMGTSGTVLYSRNVTSTTETIDSVLATSTTGAMTITFTSGYYAALGYELYIHCVGEASCTKPTNLQVEMVDDGTAFATWDSTGASLYRVYHHASGDSVWNMNPTYTNSITLSGLPADVTYDFYVVAICSATDMSAPSITRHFSTHYEAPCYAVTDLQASNITVNSASIGWISTGNLWEVAVVGGATVLTANNPYTLTGLTSNTEYSVVVRNVCDTAEGRYSEWSDTITFTTAINYYTITVSSNNNAWGTVEGGGSYAEGSSCTIKAIPAADYHFVSWQDGNTEAERTFTVTGDASYTATFAANTSGIDDVENGNVILFPNPASTMVTISGIEGESTVTVVDLNGREVVKANATGSLTIDVSGYAKGAYFVRITGERTTAVRKLVVK